MRYIYTCISGNRIKTQEEVQQTRKYKKSLELAKIFEADDVVIDICSTWNREKPNLKKILSIPENIIIVSDVSALGKKDELAEVYQQIINTRNELLICYFNNCGVLTVNDISTVDIKLEKKTDVPVADNIDMLNNISSTQYKKDGWQMVDMASAEAYWQHEKGEKSMSEVLKELGISRNTFLKRVSEYIGTDAWVERITEEDRDFNISNIPARIGEVTENGVKMYNFKVEHPIQYAHLPLIEIGRESGVELELYERAQELRVSEDEDEVEEGNKLFDRWWAIVFQSHREMLKYEKYQRNLKYRK
ncbi:MAG: hypothetical protein U0K54_03405 [Acutalibacteraceae bacterium]|nr:hypothetical protein [Acutalibacteraceae bacterium]